MSRSARLLTRGLFRNDALLAAVLIALIAIQLGAALAANVAARRERHELERSAMLRYGAVSVALEADSNEGTIIRLGRDAGLSLEPRRTGSLLRDGVHASYVAIGAEEASRVTGQGVTFDQVAWRLRVAVYDPDRKVVAWQPVPPDRVYGLEDGVLFLDLAWFTARGLYATHLADPLANEVFARAFDLSDLLETAGINAIARPWPEAVGVAAYASVGGTARLVRLIVTAMGVVAILGAFIVAVRGREQEIGLARTVGVSGVIVQNAAARAGLMYAAAAILVIGILLGGLVIAGLVLVDDLLQRESLRSALVALLMPPAIAWLVAWRVTRVPLSNVRRRG